MTRLGLVCWCLSKRVAYWVLGTKNKKFKWGGQVREVGKEMGLAHWLQEKEVKVELELPLPLQRNVKSDPLGEEMFGFLLQGWH